MASQNNYYDSLKHNTNYNSNPIDSRSFKSFEDDLSNADFYAKDNNLVNQNKNKKNFNMLANNDNDY